MPPDECVPSLHTSEEGDKKLLYGRASQPGIRQEDACEPLPAAWHGDLRGLREEQEGDTVLLCHGAPWRESEETGTEEGSASASGACESELRAGQGLQSAGCSGWCRGYAWSANHNRSDEYDFEAFEAVNSAYVKFDGEHEHDVEASRP